MEARCPDHPDAELWASFGDGTLVGSCSVCSKEVVRVNPRTGVEEWLDGHSPWTTEPLRPVRRQAEPEFTAPNGT